MMSNTKLSNTQPRCAASSDHTIEDGKSCLPTSWNPSSTSNASRPQRHRNAAHSGRGALLATSASDRPYCLRVRVAAG